MTAYAPQVTVAPATEPVTADEAKTQCRIDGTDEDTSIAGWIAAARELVEEWADRSLVTQTLRLTLDYFPGSYGWTTPDSYATRDTLGNYWDYRRLFLPRPPLQSVISIVYDAADGTATTLSPSLYRVVTDAVQGFVEPAYGQIWPITRPQSGAVRVTYSAGYGLAVAVPQRAKQAILMQVGLWYRDRGDGGEVRMTEDLHPSVKALLTSIWSGVYA